MFEPKEGGATPIIVPWSFGRAAAGAAGACGGAWGAAAGGAAGVGAGGGAAPGVPAGFGAATGGAFIMSMVPLNLGAAAAAFNVKPHLAHAVAVSWF
jgi:hypothetical protein